LTGRRSTIHQEHQKDKSNFIRREQMFHDIFEINNDQCAKNKCLYSQLISDMVAEIIVGIYQSQRTLFSLAQ